MAEQAPQAQRGGISWSQILFFIMMYWFLFGRKSAPPQNDPVSGQPLPPISNVYKPGTRMDLYVYTSDDKLQVPFEDPNSLIWVEKGIDFGSWEEENNRKKSVEIKATPSLMNNGSYYAHAFFVQPKSSPNPNEQNYKNPMVYHVHQLNKYVKTTARETKNLISGEFDSTWLKTKNEADEKKVDEKKVDEKASKKIVSVKSFWKGNYTLNLVQDFAQYARNQIPEQIMKHMSFDKLGNYYPIVFGNDFWLLNEDLMAINETTPILTIDMTFEPISLWKFSLMSQMEESFSVQKDFLGAEEGDTEDFKRLLLDNNPYILMLTFAISIVHSVLDVLAFKNDIQFWKNKKSMEGLSIRTIYINVISNLIIFLYLLDSDTSYMVLFSVFLGLVIEAWKVTRAVDVSISYYRSIPYPVFKDKNTYISQTRQHDLNAMSYLSYALYPIVICYSIYTLYYENHRSWYSWVISTLAGCVYTFGFIMMTPQLFINYKMKSVAHLPWRVFIYKAISTFIDDIFAFLIRMPTMHRLRVFRDDIIFLIYLYQRWIYPVDNKRIEVGADFEDVSLAEIEAAKAEMLAGEGTGAQPTQTGDIQPSTGGATDGKEKVE